MSVSPKSAQRSEAARLLARFEATGARVVETDILQPADVLLDLYGEDIRARAYVTADPLRGEQMLRPDFTVPVARAHLASGGGAATYAYAGEVFRRQEEDTGRPSEFLQVGIEALGGTDPADEDARIFAIISQAVTGLGLKAAIGDIGLLRTAVSALPASPARRAALMRHLWRPRRFRALLDRFSGATPASKSRRSLLTALEQTNADSLITAAGPEIGLRSRAEIVARIDALKAEASEPALPKEVVALLDELLALRATPTVAMGNLHDLAVDLPQLIPAVERLARRLDALEHRGVNTADLRFEGSYGRTTLEYYDGFVFGFYAEGAPDRPPVASGGRYDALMAALSGTTRAPRTAQQGAQGLPAVGAVIRPAMTTALPAAGAGDTS